MLWTLEIMVSVIVRFTEILNYFLQHIIIKFFWIIDANMHKSIENALT